MDRWIVILIFGQFAFTAFIIWIGTKSSQDRRRQRSEERFRLLERFGTGQELIDFLSSPAGERYFTAFSSTQRGTSHGGTAAALGTGLVVLFTGLGLLLLTWTGVGSGNFFPVFGVLGTAVGIAILIACGISLRLTRQLPAASDLEDVRRTLES